MRGMNKLPLEKRVQILSMLVEGSSLRSISRVADVSINTVTKLLVDAGMACATYHDKMVRNVAAKRVQCDEIWSFCYAKDKNVRDAKAAPDGAGNIWTWTALDSDSKLMVTWWAGDRSSSTGVVFLRDLQSRHLPLASARRQQTCGLASPSFGHRPGWYASRCGRAHGPAKIEIDRRGLPYS
jgi:lambda repressor-like predicted transcriptional regulator